MQTAARHWLHGVVAASAAATAAAGVWMLRSFDPNVAGNPFLPCLFHQFTGLYCPGCGTTRALHALVHGDIGGMFAMNPLLPVVLVAMPAVIAQSRGWRVPLPNVVMKIVAEPKLWLVVVPAYWVLRNLPWWPFSWLAPG